MRVTSRMISSQASRNASAPLSRMFRLHDQISTGKRILRASDDPVGVNQALNLRSSIAGIEQYQRNIQGTKAQLALVDNVLEDITRAVQECHRIALAGANDATDPAQREIMATQIDQQIDVILREINVKHMNRHLFGGHETLTPPVSLDTNGVDPYVYNGDDGIVTIQVGEATEIKINLTARELLNFDGAVDASQPDTLAALTRLKEALRAGDTGAITEQAAWLEKTSDHLIALRGMMGARGLQIEMVGDQLEGVRLTMGDWLSEVEDIDFVAALTELQQEQNVYQAALLATSKAIQPSLADFLR